MSPTENELLIEEIRSPSFNLFKCIDYLRKYSGSIGIHHALVQKLNQYSYDELEFFIPQFVQLLVSFETDSMALEEFLLDYCSKYPHFSLVVFWNLQAYIFELRNDPESNSFQTVRKFINKLQNILFNPDTSISKSSDFRENLLPALVLCGAIAASFAVPRMNEYASPLIKLQGKQQKSFVFKLANFQKTLTRNLTMKNQRMSNDVHPSSLSDDETNVNKVTNLTMETHQRSASVPRVSSKESAFTSLPEDSETYTTDDELERKSTEIRRDTSKLSLESPKAKTSKYSEIEDNLRINTFIKSKKSLRNQVENDMITDSKNDLRGHDQYNVNSQSMPDLSKVSDKAVRPYLSPAESESSLNFPHSSIDVLKRNNSQYSLSSKAPTYNQLLKLLQVNYAKKETEFIMSLQNISLRLSQVPKEARLSALRAELSIINETLLPSEIDIPQLLPVTSNKNKKYHKILKLSINEACVLNSAERVPFLLLIEYLSDESDFNPFSEQNQQIISSKKNQSNNSKVKDTMNILDITDTEFDSLNSLQNSPEGLKEPFIQAEADLSDLPILSHKSSGHDLTKFKSMDSPKRLASPFANDINKSPQLGNVTSTDSSTKVLADHMRIASVMLQQLDSSGQSTSEQSNLIRSRIVDSMISLQDQFDSINYEKLNQLKGDVPDAGQRKLENDFKLGEDWNTKKQRIRSSSIYGHLSNWELCSVIAKNGDDLPQEAFACQLITMISNIWKRHEVGAWTKRMKILITSANTGLVETITNAMSIHSIKKSLTEISISEGENAKGRIFTMQDYFMKIYGSPDSTRYKKAQDNFARSLASYSIICYVLQIKDRHNGNIMVDNEGHIVHIDFGFLLSNSPGSVGFEAAPFKLTSEYVDLLGGPNSEVYKKFVTLCKRCFNALRKENDQLISLVELMQKDSTLPCFNNGENTSVLLRQRLQFSLSDAESDAFVENILIGKSIGSMYTRLYDQFQVITQGIYS